MTDAEYKAMIKAECNKAAVHYNAMLALAEQEGIDIDDDDTPTPSPAPQPEPTPTPTPQPEPEPTPTPATTDPEIVYNGKSTYNIAVGDTIIITFYGMNSQSDRDFAVQMDGCYGAAPIYRYKLKQTRIDNGFRFDYAVTGNIKGVGSITMSPYKDMSDKTKEIKVIINVK